jgi:hypothetical protein
MAGRKPHEPTKQTRELVSLHATMGTTQEVVSDLLDIDLKTLRKHYRKELDQSLAKANATIGGVLFNKAKTGDTAAMIFWLKTRAQWRETNHIDHTTNGKDLPAQGLDVSKLSTEALAEIVAAANDHNAE